MSELGHFHPFSRANRKAFVKTRRSRRSLNFRFIGRIDRGSPYFLPRELRFDYAMIQAALAVPPPTLRPLVFTAPLA
jgi:hypothetical protein